MISITKDIVLVPLGIALEEEILHCIKVLMGVKNAGFLSEVQKEMVLDACNNTSKHSFLSIGCGGGKS